MRNAPAVLFSATSPLKSQLESIAWDEISIGKLDTAQLEADRNRSHVLILASAEAQTVWQEVEEHALDMPLYPVVVGDAGDVAIGASALLRLAPFLRQPVDGPMQDTVRTLLRRSASLYVELASIDPDTELLTQNSQCEWDRSSVGVVGIVRVPLNSSAQNLSEQLELLRSNAYAAVDRLPTARLSTDELWTLLLVVAVPWSREQLNNMNAESVILRKFASDTTGSRKLIMSRDESVTGLLGPVAGSRLKWHPTSDDPLRDQLHASVKNHEELDALEALFKKRLSADDFDRMIAALRRKS